MNTLIQLCLNQRVVHMGILFSSCKLRCSIDKIAFPQGDLYSQDAPYSFAILKPKPSVHARTLIFKDQASPQILEVYWS